mgnify:FL=1
MQKCPRKEIKTATNIKAYTIRNYVNNICEPDISSIIILADFFNVSTDYIIGFSDSIIPEFMSEALESFKTDLSKVLQDFNEEISRLSASHKRRC